MNPLLTPAQGSVYSRFRTGRWASASSALMYLLNKQGHMFRNKDNIDQRHKAEHAFLESMKSCSMKEGNCLDRTDGTCFYHEKIDYRTPDGCESCTCDEKDATHVQHESRKYHLVDQMTLENLVHTKIAKLPKKKSLHLLVHTCQP